MDDFDSFDFDSLDSGDNNGGASGGFDDLLTNNDNSSNNSGSTDNNLFDDAFEDTTTQNNEVAKKGITKTAIIAIILGIVGVVAVICIANAVGKANSGNKNKNNVTNSVVQQNDRDGRPVDDIMNSGKPAVQQPSKPSNSGVVLNNGWVEISNNESVTFDSEYKQLTFLVTGINHYAQKVDSKGSLMMKTTLSGSLSGLTGTYNLDIPYSKGVKLVVGDEFTVQVLMGTYASKNVVGDIKY